MAIRNCCAKYNSNLIYFENQKRTKWEGMRPERSETSLTYRQGTEPERP
jgi:hypothetical protein